MVGAVLATLTLSGFSAPGPLLPAVISQVGAHHTHHAAMFGVGVPEANLAVLRGIDRVQRSNRNGGGYFIGVTADPPESPIGYPLSLGGQALLDPPRTTSFCTGASYAALIESLDILFGERLAQLSPDRVEAIRLQEPDGGRREDGIKLWGCFNDNGWGNHYALVQYSGMGSRVPVSEALAGDFMNISWTHGGGHAVVFLGWERMQDGRIGVRYWSSQTGTDGLGDQTSPLDAIHSVMVVRLTHPERIFTFDPSAEVREKRIPGDPFVGLYDWETPEED